MSSVKRTLHPLWLAQGHQSIPVRETTQPVQVDGCEDIADFGYDQLETRIYSTLSSQAQIESQLSNNGDEYSWSTWSEMTPVR